MIDAGNGMEAQFGLKEDWQADQIQQARMEV
jgi:hypothetical protein